MFFTEEGMNKAFALLLLFFAGFAAGCATAPPRVDPFAGLSTATTTYKDLTIAVILPENTKNAVQYADEMREKGYDPVGTHVFQDYRGEAGARAAKIFQDSV